MNDDRITELAIQTDMWCDQNVAQDSIAYSNIWENKFAEFILKECIALCKGRVGNSDYNTGRMHCISDIKEHFGIEE